MKYDIEDRALLSPIWQRLKAAGQIRYQRGFPPHPGFKDMKLAADRLLGLCKPEHVLLSMRDQCLLPFIDRALVREYSLLIPDRPGRVLYRLPSRSGHHEAPGALPAPLRLHPLPFGSVVWRGRVDLIVVACTAWSASRRQLWTLDLGLTASVLAGLHEGFEDHAPPVLGPGMDRNAPVWKLSESSPVVCLAADEQEIPPDSWPARMAGHAADVVVTPTRTVILGNDGATAPGTN